MRIAKMNLSFVESAGLFPVWMIFYVMGVLKAQGIGLPFQCRHPLRYAMLGIMLCCVHIGWLYVDTGNVAPGIKLSSHIYSYFIILWLFTGEARAYYMKIKNGIGGRLIVYIGRGSFFMYLTHCLIIFAMSCLHISGFWYLRWPLCVVLSTLMACACDRLCPQTVKRYVGF